MPASQIPALGPVAQVAGGLHEFGSDEEFCGGPSEELTSVTVCLSVCEDLRHLVGMEQ